MRHAAHRIGGWIADRLGGVASAKLVAAFASVLALDSADKGAIGAMAPQIERAFGIGATDLGLLVTVSSLGTAIATLPFGWLVDRTNRTRLLTIAIASWGVCIGALACAPSYELLLVTRVALGLVIGAGVPTIASLVGDWFDPKRRGRVWGAVLSGEIIGTGVGFIVSGQLAEISWRLGMASLVVPAAALAWAVHRLPEPRRGGASRVTEDQRELTADPERRSGRDAEEHEDDGGGEQLAKEKVREQHVQPRERLVLDEDPNDRSYWRVLWYVLRVPSNLVLIVASALGYYFFGGARTFGLQLVQSEFDLAHTTAIWLSLLLGVGGVAGVALGGWAGDALLARGRLSGRPLVASVAYLTSGGFLLVTLLVPQLAIAVVPLVLGAAALGAMNPPLDAARLDIMHPHVWGRAEAVRSFFRTVAEGVAPLLFGLFVDHVFGGGEHALRNTFLVMLVPLFVSGLVALVAIKTYPRDVATADAYVERTSGEHGAAPA